MGARGRRGVRPNAYAEAVLRRSNAVVPLRVVLAPFLATLCLTGCGAESSRQSDKARAGPATEIRKKLEENLRTLPKDTSSDAPLPRETVVEMVRRYQAAGFFRGESPSEAAVR